MLRRYGPLIGLLVLISACSGGSGGPTPTPVAVTYVPTWCGAVPGRPAPGSTPLPDYTPDPHTVLCIWMRNKSRVDMAIASPSWIISKCSNSYFTGPIPTAPWGVDVYRADPQGRVTGPVIATLSATQLSGKPPFLIYVSVGPDQNVSVTQRASLPEFSSADQCLGYP